MQAVVDASGPVQLRDGAAMGEYQRYIHELEAQQGWLDADLVENGFLMVEEIGELYAAVRRYRRALARGDHERAEAMRKEAAEEVVDVLNYLLATANRLGVDVESAFRAKNATNQLRTWE
jgi:NTP pyrophosphatase (non-canonical NTP hydrolase)